MKFMFLLYGDESANETPSRLPEERAAQWRDFHSHIASVGNAIGWEALVPSDGARTVRPGQSGFSITDGPYAETKEQLGGVYILECADMAEALEFAKLMPCSAHGSVEVRQMLDKGAE